MCETTLSRMLVPGGYLLAAFYALLTPVHLAFGPGFGQVPLASLSALSSVVLVGAAFWVSRRPPAPRWAHPIAVGAGGVALANALLFMHCAPYPQSTVHVALIALSVGLVLLSRLWMAVELFMVFAGWLLFALSSPPFSQWIEAGYALIGVCIFSAFAHEARVRATGRGEALRRVAIRHRDEARAALARSEAEFQERIQIAQEQRELDARVAEAQRVESLGILAGGVAHDFNNLLATIRGSAEWIEEQLPAESSFRERIEDIVVATRSASDLTRQMLAYAGKAPVTQQLVDLNGLSKDLRALARASLPSRVELELECAASETWVRGDRTQLQQIFLNLVTNAGEALGESGSSLSVAIRPVFLGGDALEQCVLHEGALPGAYVEIAVADNGPGIREEIRGQVFDPFFSTKFTGRGLGLAAVRGIVRLHHGALALESETDTGTTVRVFLPRAEAPAKPSEMSSPEPLREGLRGRGRALVIDDDEQVGAVCARLLQQLGYRVESFTDPDRALQPEILSEVSLAVVDLVMAGVSGDECVARIRRTHPTLPVILMSGYPRQDVVARFEALGDVVFLQKPYGRGELSKACEQAREAAGQSARAVQLSESSSIDSSISITGISSSIG